MTVSVDLKDWRGTPIVVGTRIVYPGRGSSSLWMTEAEVVEIFQKEATWPRGGLQWALKVRRLRATSSWRVSDKDTKLVTLTELDRVTVVK